MNISAGTAVHKPPCMHCDIRHVGCHDACPGYQEYRAKADGVNEAWRNYKAADSEDRREAIKNRRRLYGI